MSDAGVDMSAEAITRRLRLMSELSASTPPRPAVDMSSQAVTARLRECFEMSKVCAWLGELGRQLRPGGSEAAGRASPPVRRASASASS